MHAPVFLTGYMGAGKSTIGQHLAKCLGYDFQDMDRLLVRQFHMPIRDIFATRGEATFRQAELALLHTLAQKTRAVFATGGGAMAREEAWQALAGRAIVVYLYAPPAVLFERVVFSPRERPMIDVPDAEARFYERFALREPFYQRAAITIPTHDRTPEAVATELAEMLSSGGASVVSGGTAG